MNADRTLPLGIDIGSTRVRIACSQMSRNGEVRVRAVSSRDIMPDVASTPGLFAALLDEMLRELGTRERRCVCALGLPGAVVKIVRFPKMTWPERLRAARFEARRFTGIDYDAQTHVVRVHAAGNDGAYAVGVVSRAMLEARLSLLKLAGLRSVAIDHDGFALRRAIGSTDAILDIGAEASTLHAYADERPVSFYISAGGNTITRNIASELAIDLQSAERRKRILGSAGTGGAVRDEFLTEVVRGIQRVRARLSISRIAMVGNGSRLPHLATDLETATGAAFEIPVAPILDSGAYPQDVVRAAAPDWTLAAALALWSVRS